MSWGYILTGFSSILVGAAHWLFVARKYMMALFKEKSTH